MTKERMLIQYNVDVDKVAFETSANGLYEFSRSADDADKHYIVKERSGYHVVCGKTNTTSKWTCDLSSLED